MVHTRENHAYLKRLKAKFQNMIKKLDENDTPFDQSYNE